MPFLAGFGVVAQVGAEGGVVLGVGSTVIRNDFVTEVPEGQVPPRLGSPQQDTEPSDLSAANALSVEYISLYPESTGVLDPPPHDDPHVMIDPFALSAAKT